MSKTKTVIVEGLIASGKTSLVQEIGKVLGPSALVLLEPDDKDNANPYLADYYKDTARWSFTMQCHLLSMRYRMHLHAQWHSMQGYGHALIDRSYFGDTAFARLQFKMGVMTEREFDTYSKLYHAMTASVLLPTICIRILVSPETAANRVQRRAELRAGRKCEQVISLDYLKGLEKEIDYMIRVLRQQGVTVWDIPWDEDRDSPELRKSVVESIAKRVENFEPTDSFLDLHRRII